MTTLIARTGTTEEIHTERSLDYAPAFAKATAGRRDDNIMGRG
jgi:hypothetical protein